MESQQQEQQENQQQVQVSDLIRLTQWMNDMLTPPRAQRSIAVAPGAPNREGRQEDQNVNDDDNDDDNDDAMPDLVEDEQEEQQEEMNDDARNRIARAYPRRVVRRLNFDAAALDAMQARLQLSIFGEIEGSLFGSFSNE